MTNNTRLLTAILLSALAFTQPAHSQDSTTTADTPQTDAGQDDTAADANNDLSLGEPVDQVGRTYTREVFGDWEMRCLRTETDQDPCNLYQLLQDEQGNSVAEINVFDLPPGQLAVIGATVATPLETLLTEQITLSVDGGQGKRYPFSYCSTQGCFSRIGLLAEEVEMLKKGSNATLSIVPFVDPSATVRLQVSLAGFTSGITAVQDSNGKLVEN